MGSIFSLTSSQRAFQLGFFHSPVRHRPTELFKERANNREEAPRSIPPHDPDFFRAAREKRPGEHTLRQPLAPTTRGYGFLMTATGREKAEAQSSLRGKLPFALRPGKSSRPGKIAEIRENLARRPMAPFFPTAQTIGRNAQTYGYRAGFCAILQGIRYPGSRRSARCSG